jgi:tyrosinase
MRLNSQVAFCLLARAVTNALPQGAPPTPAQPAAETATLPTEASTNTAVAASQLADLAEYAQQQANASLSSSKRGPCNLSNVAVRKEW